MNNQNETVSTELLEILGLTRWPFNVVPDPESDLIWADRKELLIQIQRTLRRISAYSPSTLHLLWAAFGAGKTHTLLFFKQLAVNNKNNQIFTIYTALPRGSRSFVDIYQAIIRGIQTDRILEIYQVIRRNPETMKKIESEMYDSAQDLKQVLEALYVGSDIMKQTARKWLLADPSLTRQEINNASLPTKIKNTDDALNAISFLTRLILASGYFRVLIMIDEFQRAGRLRKDIKNEINAGLRTYFNNCPNRLSLILSFSFGSASDIPHYLSRELQDTAESQVITIPSLDYTQASEFLNDLISSVKSPKTEQVIEKDVIPYIIRYVQDKGVMKARALIKVCSTVFSEGAMDLADGLISSISKKYVDELLSRLELIIDDKEDE